MARRSVQILSWLACAGAVVWMIFQPGFEPAVTFLFGIAGVLATQFASGRTAGADGLELDVLDIEPGDERIGTALELVFRNTGVRTIILRTLQLALGEQLGSSMHRPRERVSREMVAQSSAHMLLHFEGLTRSAIIQARGENGDVPLVLIVTLVHGEARVYEFRKRLAELGDPPGWSSELSVPCTIRVLPGDGIHLEDPSLFDLDGDVTGNGPR